MDAKMDYGSGPAGTLADRPKRDLVNRNLHREIEALIPRLTRYARVLKRDTGAADDLVQSCLTWTVTMSDGDIAFQPRKVGHTDLSDAVGGCVLIHINGRWR
jgi:hypothetical protein